MIEPSAVHLVAFLIGALGVVTLVLAVLLPQPPQHIVVQRAKPRIERLQPLLGECRSWKFAIV